MFSSLKNFYRRHRRKILVGGVVVGVYATSKYVINKYGEWQIAKVEQAQHEARKRFHYESHQKTCTSTFISFLPNIRNLIMEKIDTEQLLEILKLKPANKLEIWDQLKILSLSRFISCVVANVLLLVLLKVKMNIIGAYLFAVMSSKSNSKSSDYDIAHLDPQCNSNFSATTGDPVLTDEENNDLAENEVNALQLRYLNNIRYFLEERLPVLIDDCKVTVERQVSSIGLKDKLSHEQLRDICMAVITKLKAMHTSLNSVSHEFTAYVVDPTWGECEENMDIYSQLMNDTTKVLESIDCSLVIDKCLQFGLDQALDNFAERFETTVVPVGGVSLDDCLTQDFHCNELRVAKIIPVVNNQIHELFKVGSNKFLDILFSQDVLRQLSRNVYEVTIKEYSV